MITTANIRDYMKRINGQKINVYAVGRMDITANKGKTQWLFRKGVSRPQQKASGGMSNTSYSAIGVNSILHLSTNAATSETLAMEIYETLLTTNDLTIDESNEIVEIVVRNGGPILLGASEYDNAYDFALDFEVIYKTQISVER